MTRMMSKAMWLCISVIATLFVVDALLAMTQRGRTG
eukprot:CAMPEP_0197481244 /NCGR_PEP_ID=MMETSP1309-20131121/46084_1 /TAXON_ID=464262 /ORGANISM="Genus nov. species nov., Strain RCC998" /LENGTH=35 /DNA_ID= /DNA_START= /DNA_END= /DNA_ORIENTATION=